MPNFFRLFSTVGMDKQLITELKPWHCNLHKSSYNSKLFTCKIIYLNL